MTHVVGVDPPRIRRLSRENHSSPGGVDDVLNQRIPNILVARDRDLHHRAAIVVRLVST